MIDVGVSSSPWKISTYSIIIINYYYVALKTILSFFFLSFVSFYQRGSQKRKNVYKQSFFVKISYFVQRPNWRDYISTIYKRLSIDELCINREISRDSRQLRILVCMYILTWCIYTACNFWTVERDRIIEKVSLHPSW